MTIIYLEHSGCGNLVMATPALRAIRQQFPDSRLIVCCWERSANVLGGWSDIEINTDHIVNVIATLGKAVDYLLVSPVGAITHPMMARGAKKIIANPVKPPWIRHESEYKLDLVRKIGFSGPCPVPHIIIPDANKIEARSALESIDKYICINASYLRSDHWYRKHWGDDKYAMLVDSLAAQYLDYYFVFVGSSIDYQDANKIISYTNNINRCVNACGINDQHILTTGAILEGAKCVIGNDSGLAHISAALDIPTITIFLFTNIIKNMPIGKNSLPVYNECSDRLFCQHGRWKNCAKRYCTEISVADILRVVERSVLIGQGGRNRL